MTTEELARSPEGVLRFWRDAGPAQWFSKDPVFDATFRDTFASAFSLASDGRCSTWESRPTSALALVLLLDQYPRNAFRGTARMYATDAQARRVATAAIAAGFDNEIPEELRLFFYLPFAHAESLQDQARSVALHRRIGYVENALRHHDIIARFGRFPHRNAILGRTSTKEELAFLANGGFSG